MSILAHPCEPLATGLEITEDELIVSLADGRKLSVPIAWYPRLADATAEQRRNWEMIGPGVGFHWPDVDEDLSVEGMLLGAPAPAGAGFAGRGARPASWFPLSGEIAIRSRIMYRRSTGTSENCPLIFGKNYLVSFGDGHDRRDRNRDYSIGERC